MVRPKGSRGLTLTSESVGAAICFVVFCSLSSRTLALKWNRGKRWECTDFQPPGIVENDWLLITLSILFLTYTFTRRPKGTRAFTKYLPAKCPLRTDIWIQSKSLMSWYTGQKIELISTKSPSPSGVASDLSIFRAQGNDPGCNATHLCLLLQLYFTKCCETLLPWRQ